MPTSSFWKDQYNDIYQGHCQPGDVAATQAEVDAWLAAHQPPAPEPPATGGKMRLKTFVTSGTFIVPKTTNYHITAIGGGGGGGGGGTCNGSGGSISGSHGSDGGNTTVSGDNFTQFAPGGPRGRGGHFFGGGQGGAAGQVIKAFVALQKDEVLSFSIGSGGTGGNSSASSTAGHNGKGGASKHTIQGTYGSDGFTSLNGTIHCGYGGHGGDNGTLYGNGGGGAGGARMGASYIGEGGSAHVYQNSPGYTFIAQNASSGIDGSITAQTGNNFGGKGSSGVVIIEWIE